MPKKAGRRRGLTTVSSNQPVEEQTEIYKGSRRMTTNGDKEQEDEETQEDEMQTINKDRTKLNQDLLSLDIKWHMEMDLKHCS